MIGATVELAGSSDKWAILESYPTSTPPSWRLVRRKGNSLVGIDAIGSQLVVVAPAPTYTPGTVVPIGFGATGTVVADNGDSVTVETDNEVPAGSSGRPKWRGERSVSKGVIVANQL